MQDISRAQAAATSIVVVGAHLRGLALNHQLVDLGARFVAEARTLPIYRLFALAGTTPPKPGLLNVGAGDGAAVAVEIWALDYAGFGRFVDAIPAPLGIGTIHLQDGRDIKGFLVEPYATIGARDITGYGGWRNYISDTERV